MRFFVKNNSVFYIFGSLNTNPLTKIMLYCLRFFFVIYLQYISYVIIEFYKNSDKAFKPSDSYSVTQNTPETPIVVEENDFS